MIVNGFEKVNWSPGESATWGRTLSEKIKKGDFPQVSTNVFRSSAPMIFYYCLGWGETFFSFIFELCILYIQIVLQVFLWDILVFPIFWLLAAFIHHLPVFFKCLALNKVKSHFCFDIFPMSFQLPVCLQWPLFHLAMAIFIFILSILQWPSLSLSYLSCMAILIFIFILYILQWPSLSLSYFIFGCRPSPCPFNCLGVCNGPQRHRPRKVLLSLPSFTKNIFTTP